MFVVLKGMKYSLLYYHFQDQMTSPTPTPPFYIDTNKTLWEHDDALHVNRFYRFLRCHHALVDVLGYQPRIIDLKVSWTQPTPSYYRFTMLAPKLVIPFELHSPPADAVISSSRSHSSYKDTETISPTMMSPRSVLPKF